MEINEKYVDAWVSYWRKYVGNYHLPTWESIPDFGLYMEQVVSFVKDCLRYMDTGSPDEQIITASAINNYVRKKFMPQPLKKRYYRRHIAYLIVLCALKQSLTIAEIQKILPMDTEESELQAFYESFIEQHMRAADYFIDRIGAIKDAIVQNDELDRIFKNNATEIIVDIALISSFAKLLSERLILSEADIPMIETVVMDV